MPFSELIMLSKAVGLIELRNCTTMRCSARGIRVLMLLREEHTSADMHEARSDVIA